MAEMVMFGIAGVAVTYLARKYGCSVGKYYYWKKKLAEDEFPAREGAEQRDCEEIVSC